MTRLISNALTFLLAVSYLIFGSINPDFARDMWAPYAVVTALLAAINLALEAHDRG